MKKLRSLFASERTWRLFCVLQIIVFIGIGFLAITDRGWISGDFDSEKWHLLPYNSVFPYESIFSNDKLAWDFFDSEFWTYHHENWLFTCFVAAPLFVSKAIDWVLATKDKNQTDGK